MKKKVSIGTCSMLIIMSIVATFNITYLWCQQTFNQRVSNLSNLEHDFQKFREVRGYVEKYFIGEYDENQATDTAMKGYVVGLGDMWSHYLNKEEFSEYKIKSQGQLVGIGVSVFYDSQSERMIVSQVYDGSPAQKEGISINDEIIAVDGKSVRELGYATAVDSVKGKEGTKVLLTVEKAVTGDEADLSITRTKIAKVGIQHEMLEGNIGLIEIKDFDLGVDKDFISAVKDLSDKGAKAYVFDVRFNPGGNVDVMSNMLDILVPEGNIITLTDKQGKSVSYDSGAEEINLPMAVLINEHSYSAAEFFAQTLREYGKAVIVGEKTVGKGYSQQPIELKDGSALLLSTSKYYTKSGKNLAGIGVEPDFEVKLSDQALENFYRLSPKDDAQLSKAMQELNSK